MFRTPVDYITDELAGLISIKEALLSMGFQPAEYSCQSYPDEEEWGTAFFVLDDTNVKITATRKHGAVTSKQITVNGYMVWQWPDPINPNRREVINFIKKYHKAQSKDKKEK